MKYVKILGLAAVAAMALTAFLGAGSASATVLCKTTSTPCGAGWIYSGPLVLSKDPGTTPILESTGGTIEDTCTEAETSGEITNAGGASSTVVGSVEHLSFNNCTNTTTVTVETGTLELHHISGTDNGTVTASGAFAVDITFAGVTCTYGVGNGIDLGTFTGGKPATMDVNAVVPKKAGGFLCPSDSVWKANYVVTTPANTTLHVEPE